MDRANQSDLLSLARDQQARAKVFLLRQFDPAHTDDELDVPDPYYGGSTGFEHVFDVCEAACQGLLASLRKELRA
jgi:protein-tyrosine phosphatase